jgi:hypothetical protein
MLAAAIATALATVALGAVALLQMRAGSTQAREQVEAVKRGVQPRVTAHRWVDPKRRRTYGEEVVSLHFYLTNDGTGPAFNVVYGVDVGGRSCPGDNGHIYRKMNVGAILPGPSDHLDPPGSTQPIVVDLKHEGRPRDEIDRDLVYWTRFDNVMGERFEVRNPHDTTRPTEVRKQSP